MKNSYHPHGKHIWDAWFIKSGKDYHMFHLQALPARDINRKHHERVSIGHAVSEDLISWQELPVALDPGIEGEWDDLALWTGSIIKKDGQYFMFYTGRSQRERLVQQIGLATSFDLLEWKKDEGNPILSADNKLYQMANSRNRLGKISAWRDPYVWQDPKTKKYYLFISAREAGEATEYNACIAVAESEDLISWSLSSPILSPGIYDEMETPQMIFHDDYYYLFFSTHTDNYQPHWAQKYGAGSGPHCYYSTSLFGEYKPINGDGVVSDEVEDIYDIKILENIGGHEFMAIGSINRDESGQFIGRTSLPFKVAIKDDKIIKI